MASKVQRYEIADIDGGGSILIESETGDIVYFDDHAAKVRELEAAVEVACMSHIATTNALTSDCYTDRANSKTHIELRTRAAKAAAMLYSNPTTKAVIDKIEAAAIQKVRNDAGLGKGATP